MKHTPQNGRNPSYKNSLKNLPLLQHKFELPSVESTFHHIPSLLTHFNTNT